MKCFHPHVLVNSHSPCCHERLRFSAVTRSKQCFQSFMTSLREPWPQDLVYWRPMWEDTELLSHTRHLCRTPRQLVETHTRAQRHKRPPKGWQTGTRDQQWEEAVGRWDKDTANPVTHHHPHHWHAWVCVCGACLWRAITRVWTARICLCLHRRSRGLKEAKTDMAAGLHPPPLTSPSLKSFSLFSNLAFISGPSMCYCRNSTQMTLFSDREMKVKDRTFRLMNWVHNSTKHDFCHW